MHEPMARPSYWDEYYRHRTVPVVPSQFAVFVHGELTEGSSIIDIGCGSGRDSIFFAQCGLDVLGIDQSPIAIDTCNRRASELGIRAARFVAAPISNTKQIALEAQRMQGPRCVYARFFLHAIDDEAEQDFISVATQIVAKTPHSIVAVEFRTERDRNQQKVTPEHYRRFVNPMTFATKCINAGMSLDYFVEGFGFAKHHSDDAHVARYIFRS